MALMLTAQAAHLSDDAMGARVAYETMLAKPDTRLLGLRGLFGEARRRGEHAAARSFAEEAAKEKPGIGWAGNALLEYQAAAGEWAAALDTLQSITTVGGTAAANSTRLRAVLLTARAGELERGRAGDGARPRARGAPAGARLRPGVGARRPPREPARRSPARRQGARDDLEDRAASRAGVRLYEHPPRRVGPRPAAPDPPAGEDPRQSSGRADRPRPGRDRSQGLGHRAPGAEEPHRHLSERARLYPDGRDRGGRARRHRPRPRLAEPRRPRAARPRLDGRRLHLRSVAAGVADLGPDRCVRVEGAGRAPLARRPCAIRTRCRRCGRRLRSPRPRLRPNQRRRHPSRRRPRPPRCRNSSTPSPSTRPSRAARSRRSRAGRCSRSRARRSTSPTRTTRRMPRRRRRRQPAMARRSEPPSRPSAAEPPSAPPPRKRRRFGIFGG